MNPTSPFVLVLVFGFAAALLVGLVRARLLVLKLAAGALALVLATFGGIVSVNDYFGYYQSWHDAYTDLSGQSLASPGTAPTSTTASSRVTTTPHGRVIQLTITGALSHQNRVGDVYLPPQYDQPQYRNTRFPVIELLHGTPGNPASWFVSMNVAGYMDQMIANHQLGPMILVAPFLRHNNTPEECLNTTAVQDETYAAVDVPAFMRAHYRVASSGSEWGLLGESGGGFCGANIALNHRADWGAMAAIDGYFLPSDGPAGKLLQRYPASAATSNPLVTAHNLPSGTTPLPSVWLSAGTGNADDITEANLFIAAMAHLEQVHLVTLVGGNHTGYSFRQTEPQALAWLWSQLAPPELRVLFPISGPAVSTVQAGRPGHAPRLMARGTSRHTKASHSRTGAGSTSSHRHPAPASASSAGTKATASATAVPRQSQKAPGA